VNGLNLIRRRERGRRYYKMLSESVNGTRESLKRSLNPPRRGLRRFYLCFRLAYRSSRGLELSKILKSARPINLSPLPD
jgi:hypothetical protein